MYILLNFEINKIIKINLVVILKINIHYLNFYILFQILKIGELII